MSALEQDVPGQEREEEQVLAATGFDVEEQAQAADAEDAGTEVPIVGADDEPVFYMDAGKRRQVWWKVAGTHSSYYRKVEETLRKRRLKARTLTQGAMYEDNVERVVACSLGWGGFNNKGVPLPQSGANIRNVIKRCPWVLPQLLEAMNDHERFFTNS